MIGPPLWICFSKRGITDPVDPSTLPKRRILKFVLELLLIIWIYFSQTKDDSFGKHNDKNANIIIQQEGTSHAKIWKGDELIIDEELTKGEMIFIPALCDHEIRPLTNRISVSFPIAFGHSDIQERDWVKLCMN